jgi:hypothetical protein
VEFAFVQSLNEYGLVEIISFEEKPHLSIENIGTVELLIRLHNDLNINVEGIDAITHLLQRMKSLQQEITALKNKLENY